MPAATVASSPGPRPPYQALIIMAPRISRKGLSCTISGSRSSLIANAAPTASTAKPYRNSPFSPLVTLTTPFCAFKRHLAYPKCSILEIYYLLRWSTVGSEPSPRCGLLPCNRTVFFVDTEHVRLQGKPAASLLVIARRMGHHWSLSVLGKRSFRKPRLQAAEWL